MDTFDRVKKLEERFLSQDEKTGDPNVDGQTEIQDQGVTELEEVDAFMAIAQNASINAYIAIEMLLKHGTKEALDKHFGEGSAELLNQTKDCLESIADMFAIQDFEPDSEDSEETEEPADAEASEEPEEMEGTQSQGQPQDAEPAQDEPK